MRFLETRAAKLSMATELKRLAWLGGAAFTLLGFGLKSFWLAISVAIWWLANQWLAHWVIDLAESMARMEDKS